MRACLLVIGVLAGCSSKASAPPAGPPVLATCDYVSKTTQTNHTCTEIYEASQLAVAEKFCTSLRGPRDRGTFAKGGGCPTDGRHGGCLNTDGSVAWIYEGEHACMFGQPFADAPPAHGPLEPYRCQTGPMCQEEQAVLDLTKTVDAKNCATGGGTFAKGACPTANAIGSCTTGDVPPATKHVFYAPITAAQAQTICEDAPFTAGTR